MRVDLNDIVLTDEQIKIIQEKYTEKIEEAIKMIDPKELAKDIKDCIMNDIEDYLFDNVDLSVCVDELSKFATRAVKIALGGGKKNGRD